MEDCLAVRLRDACQADRPAGVAVAMAPSGTDSCPTGPLELPGLTSVGRAPKPDEVDNLSVAAERVDHSAGSADLVE